jgi:hypothetical protein
VSEALSYLPQAPFTGEIAIWCATVEVPSTASLIDTRLAVANKPGSRALTKAAGQAQLIGWDGEERHEFTAERQFAKQLDRFREAPTRVICRPDLALDLSFPKIISGCIDGVAPPRSEWLQWRQTVGQLDVTAHLSVMPSAYALDCNTLHRRKESAVGAPHRR